MNGQTTIMSIDSGDPNGDSFVLLAIENTTEILSAVRTLGTRDLQLKVMTLLQDISQNMGQRTKDFGSVKRLNVKSVPTYSILRKLPLVSVPSRARVKVTKKLAYLLESGLITSSSLVV